MYLHNLCRYRPRLELIGEKDQEKDKIGESPKSRLNISLPAAIPFASSTECILQPNDLKPFPFEDSHIFNYSNHI